MVNLMLNEDELAIVDIVGSEKSVKKLPERVPIDFVINNGICYLFYKKVGDRLDSNELEQIQDKVEETRLLIEEVHNLSKIFKENNISFAMLSKAIESQCDSREVDVPVKDTQMEKLKRILEHLGYISVPWGLSPYAKRVGEVILHVDPSPETYNIVFDGERKYREIDGIYTLSPEDELSGRILKPVMLRSTRITLCNIIHISNLLEKYNIQQLPKNIKKSYFIPCLHSIHLINILYKALYSKDIKAPIVERAKDFHKRSRIWNFLSKFETRKINLPFRSCIFSYSCLLYKLLYDLSHFNFKEIIRSIPYLIEFITIPIPVSNTYISMSIISLRRILKKKRILICFTGMDGTGKTSHATKITKRFKSMGIPCQYVWCNWDSRVSYPFMAFIYLLTGGYRRKDYHKSKILRRIWNYIVIFDFLYIYLSKVKVPLLIGKNVVCDRYVYDMIASLMYDGLYSERGSKILLKLIPKPDLIFMLDIPEDVSDSRKSDTKDAVNIKESDNAIDYLRIHRNAYLKIAESLNIPVIDATREFDELHEEMYLKVLQTYIDKQVSKK